MGLYGTLWDYMGLYGIIWDYMGLCDHLLRGMYIQAAVKIIMGCSITEGHPPRRRSGTSHGSNPPQTKATSMELTHYVSLRFTTFLYLAWIGTQD